MARWKTKTWLLFGSVGFLVFGCAYVQPDRDIETDPQPIKEGPGLLTGRSGEWVIIRKR